MSDHVIRYATEEDFDDVMAFGDVYLGVDYLRHRFHSFIKDSSARSYVYMIGQEIVGYCCAFVVDDGMTLLIRASRVKVGYQGQGIYGKLTRHVYDEHKQIPSVKFEAFTTNDMNFDVNKTGIMKKYSLLSEKAFMNYKFKAADLHLPEPPKDGLEEVTSEDMTSLLADKNLHSDLFPGNKIIIDWVPLRPMQANMKYIMNQEIAAAYQTKNTRVKLLSFGTRILCDLGQRYMTDVHGSDVTPLRHHILCHLHKVKSLTKGDVVFQIVCVKDLEKSVDEVVRSFGISDFGYKMTMLFNFEKDFP